MIVFRFADLVSKAEDVRVLDNEFSIFLNLTKKLPPECKVQLRLEVLHDCVQSTYITVLNSLPRSYVVA